MIDGFESGRDGFSAELSGGSRLAGRLEAEFVELVLGRKHRGARRRREELEIEGSGGAVFMLYGFRSRTPRFRFPEEAAPNSRFGTGFRSRHPADRPRYYAGDPEIRRSTFPEARASEDDKDRSRKHTSAAGLPLVPAAVVSAVPFSNGLSAVPRRLRPTGLMSANRTDVLSPRRPSGRNHPACGISRRAIVLYNHSTSMYILDRFRYLCKIISVRKPDKKESLT